MAFSGLIVDSLNGEVYGLAQKWNFRLECNCIESSGKTTKVIQLKVNKTPPSLASSAPKNLSSTTARFAGRMISDGGEPANLSLFWGENDGGSNMLTDPLDASKWDYRIDLNDSFSTGGFNYFVDGLEKNQTYYYRWMGGNSVSPQVWSTPTEDGLIQWWKLMRMVAVKF